MLKYAIKTETMDTIDAKGKVKTEERTFRWGNYYKDLPCVTEVYTAFYGLLLMYMILAAKTNCQVGQFNP